MKKSHKTPSATLTNSPFGDTLIPICKGMAADGRNRGVEVDETARTITIRSPLTRDQVLNIDNPQCREKATFAGRLAAAIYQNQAGSLLAYEAPVQRDGENTKYIDASMRLACDTDKTVGVFEVKIADGANPTAQIEEAMSQGADYIARLFQQGKLAPLLAFSLMVFSEKDLEDVEWKAAAYFNAQGGPASAKAGSNFMEAARSLFVQHRMVCVTWLFDLSTPEKAKKLAQMIREKTLLLQTPPVAFTAPYFGEFPMKGDGRIVATNGTSVTFHAGAKDISLAPTTNMSGASLLQNTRGIQQNPVSAPGEARLGIVIEKAKEQKLKNLSAEDIQAHINGYAGKQTGANTRRIMAMKDETLWTEIKGAGPNGTMLLVSTNSALSDGQSSTVCFSALAKAAEKSSNYKEFCDNLRGELKFYGIAPDFAEELEAKFYEGALTQQEQDHRFNVVKAMLTTAEFEVKVEFPTTQEEGARSSQAANQVYPQSSVDMNIAKNRTETQAVYDTGKRMAKTRGVDFPYELPKHQRIEHSDNVEISEMFQGVYMGEAAAPEVYGGSGLNKKGLGKALMDAEGVGTLLSAKYGSTRNFSLKKENAEEKLKAAAEWQHRAGQALSRAGYESGSEGKRMLGAIEWLMPSFRRGLRFLEAVMGNFTDAITGRGVEAALASMKAEIAKQEASVKKEGTRLVEAVKAKTLDGLSKLSDFVEMNEQDSSANEEGLRVEFRKHYGLAAAKLAQGQEPEQLLRLGMLRQESGKQARQLLTSGKFDKDVDLSEKTLARLICSSIQLSWKDGGLGLDMDFSAWSQDLPRRAAKAADALADKIMIIKAVTNKFTREHVKGIGKGAMEMINYRGGKCAGALPSAWSGVVEEDGAQKTVYPAHKCMALWLLHAGIGLDGSWPPESDKPDTQKPVLLISK